MLTLKYVGLFTIALLALPLLAGCESTYVNIPAQAGDVADHDPNADNVAAVMALAVSEVAYEMPAPGTSIAGSPAQGYRLVLPVGSSYVTYEDVAAASDWVLSPKYANRLDTSVPAIEVAQVRIRGWRSEVDVIRPFPPLEPDKDRQLVTVRMGWSATQGWQVRHVLPWTLDVDAALRESRTTFEEAPVTNEVMTPDEPQPVEPYEPVGSFEPVEPEPVY